MRRDPDTFAPKDPAVLRQIKHWNQALSKRGLSVNRGAGILIKIAAKRKKNAARIIRKYGRHTKDVMLNTGSTPIIPEARQPKSNPGGAGPGGSAS